MNRYMKHKQSYRLAIVCFAIALATIIWVATVSAVLFLSPSSSSALGLSTWSATVTLFFVPTIIGATLMLGTDFWFIAGESKIIGRVRPIENAEETYQNPSLQKPL